MSLWDYFENPRVVIEVEGSAGELPKIRGGCGNLAEKVPGGRGMGFGRGVAGVSSGWRPDRPGGWRLNIQDARGASLDSIRASRNPWAHDQQSARNRLTAFRFIVETPPRVPDGAEGFLLNETSPGCNRRESDVQGRRPIADGRAGARRVS